MKLEYIKTTNWLPAIYGARHPLKSYHLIDSIVDVEEYDLNGLKDFREIPTLGPNDLRLTTQLAKAGGSHSKFLRQVGIILTITAPMYWWTEFDTYKIGTTANSTSKMFKLGKSKLTKEDFLVDEWNAENLQLLEIVNKKIELYLSEFNKKDNKDAINKAWRDLQQSVPSSFLYTRTVSLNYEVLRTIYKNRKNHKLIEWRNFCSNIIKSIPYGELFIKDNN